MLSTLLKKTDPARRRLGTAIVVGIIGGFFSAIVKFGWEVPFPPRTPERNATNPPQHNPRALGKRTKSTCPSASKADAKIGRAHV